MHAGEAADGDAPARILVVDDTPANLYLLNRILASQGYAVHASNSGETALRFMQSIVPDAVLLDVTMPYMDGYEVCRAMKADDRLRHVPVIFVSGQDASWNKTRAFTLGAIDYVVKPIDEIELLARLDTHLSLHRLRRQLERRLEERSDTLAKTKEALFVNQRLLKSIIDTSRAVIWVKDLDGHYMLVNRRFMDLFGGGRDDLRGLTDEDIFPAEIAAAIRESDVAVSGSGNPVEIDELLPHGDEMRNYISVKSLLRDLDGLPYAVCCIATDITDRVRDEAALRELNEMLESRLLEHLSTRTTAGLPKRHPGAD